MEHKKKKKKKKKKPQIHLCFGACQELSTMIGQDKSMFARLEDAFAQESREQLPNHLLQSTGATTGC
jgi:hypothetical protein